MIFSEKGLKHSGFFGDGEHVQNLDHVLPPDPGFELLSFPSQARCGLTLVRVHDSESGVFAASQMVNSRKEAKQRDNREL